MFHSPPFAMGPFAASSASSSSSSSSSLSSFGGCQSEQSYLFQEYDARLSDDVARDPRAANQVLFSREKEEALLSLLPDLVKLLRARSGGQSQYLEPSSLTTHQVPTPYSTFDEFGHANYRLPQDSARLRMPSPPPVPATPPVSPTHKPLLLPQALTPFTADRSYAAMQGTQGTFSTLDQTHGIFSPVYSPLVPATLVPSPPISMTRSLPLPLPSPPASPLVHAQQLQHIHHQHCHQQQHHQPKHKPQQQLLHTPPQSPSPKKSKAGNYKTEMCRSLQETGCCKYGAHCQFAHSSEELRTVSRHPLYRTKLCKEFWSNGVCPYGKRCGFIHEQPQH